MSELAVGSLAGLAANSYVIDVASGSQLTQPGMVLQVVSATKTDTFSTTSTSFTSVTGLNATITPSSTSSKILVIVTIGNMSVDSTRVPAGRIVANGSPILVATGTGSRNPATFTQVRADNRGGSQSASGLHEPSTTSAVTYGVEVRTNAGTLYVNRDRDDGDSATYSRPVSSITLMEIAG